MSVKLSGAYRFFPLFLVLYELAAYFSNDMYLPALPHMMHDLNIADHYAQLTITMWFLGSASLQLVLGPLSDRYGRRPMLLLGGALFFVATMVCGLTSDITILLAARFVQGVTVTTLLISGYATIHELFDQKQAIVLIAWMNSITVLAPAFGPLFGAFIIHFASWRWIFIALALLSGVCLLALIPCMPETRSENAPSLNFKKLFKDYYSIIKTRQFVVNSSTAALLFSGIIAWIAAGPFIVMTIFKQNVWHFAFYQILICGSFILGTRLVKPILEKIQAEQLILFGISISALAGVLGVACSLMWPHDLMGLIMPLMLFQFACGMTLSSLNRTAIDACTAPMGARIAVYSSFFTGAGVVGSGAVSLFYDDQLIHLSGIVFAVSVTALAIQALSAWCRSKDFRGQDSHCPR